MVTARRVEGLVAELTARTHRFVAGLPESLGGQDDGPTPHEILESALAACTILTVQMYANRKGWKLESTDVEVKIVEENGRETRIARKLTFVGELSGEERLRLLDIAEKCPIHRLLEGQVKIETTVM